MDLPLCSLYFGAFLANLNSRNYIRQGHSEVSWNDVPSRLATQRPVVTVTTETIVLSALGKPPGMFEVCFISLPSIHRACTVSSSASVKGQAPRSEVQKDLEGGQPISETGSKASKVGLLLYYSLVSLSCCLVVRWLNFKDCCFDAVTNGSQDLMFYLYYDYGYVFAF